MRSKRKTLQNILIPICFAIGIFVLMPNNTLAVGEGDFVWLGADPYTYSTDPEDIGYGVEYSCDNMGLDTQHLWYQIGTGDWTEINVAHTVLCAGGYHYMQDVDNADINFKFCDALEGIIDCDLTVTTVTFTDGEEEPTVTGMPQWAEGDVDSLLVALGSATTGILAFFVDGAELWLTLAGALLIIYLFRRFLGLRGAKPVFRKIDKQGIKANIKRQKELEKRRRY